MRLVRRKVDSRVEAATAAHAAGDFVRARELAVEVVADGEPSLEAVRGLAELEYLLGDYDAAESLLRRVVGAAGRNAGLRVDAEVVLALVYLQTNRFAASSALFAGSGDAIELPVWELMRSFGDEEPYRIDWGGEPAGDPRPSRDSGAAADRGGRRVGRRLPLASLRPLPGPAAGPRAAGPARRVGSVRHLPPRLPAPVRPHAGRRGDEDDVRDSRCLTGACRSRADRPHLERVKHRPGI